MIYINKSGVSHFSFICYKIPFVSLKDGVKQEKFLMRVQFWDTLKTSFRIPSRSIGDPFSYKFGNVDVKYTQDQSQKQRREARGKGNQVARIALLCILIYECQK